MAHVCAVVNLSVSHLRVAPLHNSGHRTYHRDGRKSAAMEQADLQAKSTRELLDVLDAAKHSYGETDTGTKLRALRILQARTIRQASQLARYHDILCFLQAYPDGKELLALVEGALAGIAGRVDDARAHTSEQNVARLDDTGIAGTAAWYPFSYRMAEWLARSFPDDVSIDWDAFENEDKLLGFLPQLVAYLEYEALDDLELETRRWLTMGQEPNADLGALVGLFSRSGLAAQTVESMYELLDVPVVWRLRGPGASRTLAKVPTARVHYQTGPLSRSKEGVARQVRRPLNSLRQAGAAESDTLINAARAALAVRLRDIDPLAQANAGDVWVAAVGRGVAVVLIGMLPRRRMPLESTYFFLLLKNGVPVGYGSGSGFVDRCEVAANIFPAFRRGESAYIYGQALRTFRQAFGSSSFLIDKGQFGYDNPEGIKSGAFWFYYKMGFRPVDGGVARLAEREAAKMAKRRGYRSSPGTLEELAESDLLLSLTGRPPVAGTIRLGNIGKIVSDFIGREFGGDRDAATRSSMRRLKEVLPLGKPGRFTSDEAEAVRRFAPLVVQMPGLKSWRAGEKAALVNVMRAKGGPSEMAYARALAGHARLLSALGELSERGARL